MRYLIPLLACIPLLTSCSSNFKLPWEDAHIDPNRIRTIAPLEIPPDLEQMPKPVRDQSIAAEDSALETTTPVTTAGAILFDQPKETMQTDVMPSLTRTEKEDLPQWLAPMPEGVDTTLAFSESGATTKGSEDTLKKIHDEVNTLLDRWISAWSNKKLQEYFSFYAADFVPANGKSRAQWEKKREEVIQSMQTIFITRRKTRLNLLPEGKIRVLFIQTYDSDRYNDIAKKMLILTRESGLWRILREQEVR
ncbi:L,D-transpeptidase Cds6 family protein [Magnetococcales bacterium HHB-1]